MSGLATEILGVAPSDVVTPSDRAECVEAFTRARAARRTVACVGGGTELGLGARPTRLDVALRTTKLSRVLDYTPADQVVDVEGGLTLGALQDTLAAHGQRLALDPPGARGATVGGLVATAAFGPLRARYGGVRDLIIGVTMLRADGKVARGGGKVVKTVAGFDLPKLATGSLGTLGMILGVTFRVHPLPEASATVVIGPLSAADVRAVTVAVRAQQLEPAAIAAIGTGDAYALGARFEGFAAGVAEQRARLSDHATRAGHSCEVLDGAAAAHFWDAHDAVRGSGDVSVKVSGLPAALAARLPALAASFAPALAQPRVAWYPSLGLALVQGRGAADPRALPAALARARALAAEAQGHAIVQRAPLAAHAAGLDVWGPPPSSLALMKEVKARFDPEGRMNPGRFVGGI